MASPNLIPEYLHFVFNAPFLMSKLIQNRKLKPDELKKLQNKKLRAIIKQGVNHVPYYKSLFKKARITPEEIKSIEDLKKIPISHKELLAHQPLERIIANNMDLSRCFKWRTAGTTGLALSTYRTLHVRLLDHLLATRWQMECGTGLFDRRLSIGLDYLVNPLLFTFKLAISLSARSSLRRQIEQITRFKPKIVLGYPSSLWILANELREKKYQDIDVETIYTSGELLDKNTRRMFREVFGADTYDGYGAIEVGGICTECVEHSGYHIWADSIIVEIIRDGEALSPGEEGEIVVTNLSNHVMPFIRYNLRDLGLMMTEKSSCGNRLPLMKITSGRPQYVTQLPDDNQIPAWELISFLLFVQGVKRFKLIQKDLNEFKIKIVKSADFTTETIKDIKEKFISRLKLRLSKEKIKTINVELEIVDHIPKDKSGKFEIFEAPK